MNPALCSVHAVYHLFKGTELKNIEYRASLYLLFSSFYASSKLVIYIYKPYPEKKVCMPRKCHNHVTLQTNPQLDEEETQNTNSHKTSKDNYRLFCLLYDLLNVILSPTKFVYFHENLHCCNGRRHVVTWNVSAESVM